MWRILTDSLPTKEKLARVFNTEDAVCPLCSLGRENPLHLFKDCILVRMIYFGSKWALQVDQCNGGTFKVFLLWILNQVQALEKDDLICFSACVFDIIWRARNNLVFKNGKIDPIQLRKDCHNAYLEMSLLRNRVEPPGTFMELSDGPLWSPRETGVMKVSTDASFVESKCGLAGIFRDDARSILLLTFKSGSANSPFEAKCLAVQLALTLTCALEKGWSRLIVESDAAILVNSLQSGKYPPD